MTLPDQSRASAPTQSTRVYALLRYWPAAVAILAAVLVRSFSWLNCDVSWLLTLGERVLAGARPYIDFTEPNPPASILIYMPAILMGRSLGIEPELAVSLLIFAGVLLSLWLCSRILSDSGPFRPQDRPNLAALCCVLLLILPGDAFAQREHIALLALMPMLCVYAKRANGDAIGGSLAALAGVGAGIAIAIKPYFAFAPIIPLAYVGLRLRQRGQRILPLLLAPEHIAVAVMLALYAGMIIALFSDYTRVMLPIVLAVYAPWRITNFLPVLAMSTFLIAMNCALARAVGATKFREPSNRVFVLAVLGFAIAMLAQGKGWPYQSYPAIALSLFVLAALLVDRLSAFLRGTGTEKPSSIDVAFGVLLFAGIYALASVWFLFQPNEAKLVSEVARLVPVHPKVLSLSDGPEIAFPLTRKLQGTPLGRSPFQWVSQNADGVLASIQLDPAARRKIEDYKRADRIELVDTIRTRRPDVILIGGQIEHQWAFSYPEIVRALQPYRWAKTVDKIEIWLPRAASQRSRQ